MPQTISKTRLIPPILFVFLALALFVRADEFTSSSFKILEPVLQPAGYSTSDSYSLIGTIAQLAIGTSTASSFNLSSGFLFFPFASSPVVTATAGDGQVSLSWTSSSGFLGWTVSGYNVGKSTISGGPYTYSASLGNVTSSIRTGLTNGTTYYFVVRAEDAFGNSIATSSEASSAPVAPSPTPAPGTTTTTIGGGGGGIIEPPRTSSVVFSGRAYPLSAVTLLKDAQIAVLTIAGPDSNFNITLAGLSAGDYIFSLYSKDKDGLRSVLFNFQISLTLGATTNVSGIFIAPTISVDKSEVKKGDNIAVFGQSAPRSEIVIAVNSEEAFFAKTEADKDGIYLYNFDTSLLDYGRHNVRSKAAREGLVSGFSSAIDFKVGARTISASKLIKVTLIGDLNSDERVNLIDFSIMAYWYKRPSLPASVDLNSDERVNLIDFSIMAYYWTG